MGVIVRDRLVEFKTRPDQEWSNIPEYPWAPRRNPATPSMDLVNTGDYFYVRAISRKH